MDYWIDLSIVVRNFGIIAAGFIAIYLAWRRVSAADVQSAAATDQVSLSQRDHATALFNIAVGQLSHKNLEIRLGAIYTLEQIAVDFAEFRRPIKELLAAFLKEKGERYSGQEPPIDVQEIMRLLTRRKFS